MQFSAGHSTITCNLGFVHNTEGLWELSRMSVLAFAHCLRLGGRECFHLVHRFMLGPIPHYSKCSPGTVSILHTCEFI